MVIPSEKGAEELLPESGIPNLYFYSICTLDLSLLAPDNVQVSFLTNTTVISSVILKESTT